MSWSDSGIGLKSHRPDGEPRTPAGTHRCISHHVLQRAEEFQRFERFFLIQVLDGETRMHDDVVSGLHVREEMKPHVTLDAPHLDPTKSSVDTDDPHGYSNTHGVLL